MSFIGDIFSSSKGSGFQATSAPIDRPITPEQAQQELAQAQMQQQKQNQFVDALASQNGIGNQSQALAAQQTLAQQLAANNGAANQASTFARQGQTADQLQGVANGTGPNPAAAMLASATGNNVANTAALMAGQRGASSNAGLLARQAGQVGANAQQQAAGQGATLQANQSLNALGQLGGQEQAMQAAAANQVAQQASQQANIANLASQQVQQQASAQGTALGAQQAQEANLLNQVNSQNNTGVTMQGNVNNANAGIAGINAKKQGDILSGIGNAVMGLGSKIFAHGGPVTKMADGGMAPSPITQVAPVQSHVMDYFHGPGVQVIGPSMSAGPSISPGGDSSESDKKAYEQGQKMGDKFFGDNSTPVSDGYQMPQMGSQFAGSDPSLMSSAASAGPNLAMAALAKGGPVPKRPIVGETMAAQGKLVPGKAKVKGDNIKNDTVPAVLSPGEVVLPRSVMNSKDPVKEAARFVAAVMAKNGKGLKRG